MGKKIDFNLKNFMPYLLNQAAEQLSLEFQQYYKQNYGMLRTEWRVLFHIGHYGEIGAKEICDKARIHKTKVSRAVRALEEKRYLNRNQQSEDRRHEILNLTPKGQTVYQDLKAEADRFDADLMQQFSKDEQKILRRCLTQIAKL